MAAMSNQGTGEKFDRFLSSTLAPPDIHLFRLLLCAEREKEREKERAAWRRGKRRKGKWNEGGTPEALNELCS
jgi:hypothetical protein